MRCSRSNYQFGFDFIRFHSPLLRIISSFSIVSRLTLPHRRPLTLDASSRAGCQGWTGSGGANLRCPTGGAAYGRPRHTSTDSSLRPIAFPDPGTDANTGRGGGSSTCRCLGAALPPLPLPPPDSPPPRFPFPSRPPLSTPPSGVLTLLLFLLRISSLPAPSSPAFPSPKGPRPEAAAAPRTAFRGEERGEERTSSSRSGDGGRIRWRRRYRPPQLVPPPLPPEVDIATRVEGRHPRGLRRFSRQSPSPSPVARDPRIAD